MKGRLLLLCIVLLAFGLRVAHINWDSGMHLHPDERFLTMVVGNMKIPKSLAEYLDPAVSPMNPYNLHQNFFVYGTFPTSVTKLFAVFTGMDTYAQVNLLGRGLNAFLDTITVLFVFGIALDLRKRLRLSQWIPYLSAFAYAIAVYPIQIAHFFTADTFLSFFMIGSLYFMMQYFENDGKAHGWLIAGSVWFGLSIASKANAVFIAPLLAVFFLLLLRKQSFLSVVIRGAVFGLIAYAALRVGDPRFFANGNWFDIAINPQLLNNIAELEIFSRPDVWYPPGVQWFGTAPVLFLLRNTVIFAVGIPYALCVFIGTMIALKKRDSVVTAIVLWTTLFFVYQSIQTVKTIRYIIFLFPIFAVFAGIGIMRIMRYFHVLHKKLYTVFHIQHPPKFGLSVGVILVIISLWTVAFMHIYMVPNTRVAASTWIYANIPQNSYILHEYWDDGLPLPVAGVQSRVYRYFDLPVFDPDTPPKWSVITHALNAADYYILSSNRVWGSVGHRPDRYPEQIAFYHQLMEGKTAYRLVKRFVSYPSLCIPFTSHCISFPDQSAEELFTVYDHPEVLIFQHVR